MLKSERTRLYILDTVAPIFNANGYSAMSLSKITEATGLTKGAIYGHFKNKEELASEAFRHCIRKVLKDLNTYVNKGKTPLDMLLNIAGFYGQYYEYSKQNGGCPILNIGVDVGSQDNSISSLVRSYNNRILKQLSKLIDDGKAFGQLKKDIDSDVYAKRFFYMIEGAAYISYIMKDGGYLIDLQHNLEQIINTELTQ